MAGTVSEILASNPLMRRVLESIAAGGPLFSLVQNGFSHGQIAGATQALFEKGLIIRKERKLMLSFDGQYALQNMPKTKKWYPIGPHPNAQFDKDRSSDFYTLGLRGLSQVRKRVSASRQNRGDGDSPSMGE